MLQAKLTCILEKDGDSFIDGLAYREAELLADVMAEAVFRAVAIGHWAACKFVVSLIDGDGETVVELSP